MSEKIDVAPARAGAIEDEKNIYDDKNADLTVTGANALDHIPSGEDVEIKK